MGAGGSLWGEGVGVGGGPAARVGREVFKP